jgi:carbon storage regulator
MLILTRQVTEAIIINNNIRVAIVSRKGKQIRLEIKAPKHIPIYREEIFNRIQQQKDETIT